MLVRNYVSKSLKTNKILRKVYMMTDEKNYQSSTNLAVSNPDQLEKDVPNQKRKRVEHDKSFVKKMKKHVYNIEDCLNETEYYFENGLRKVYPYYFAYNTYCKGRWLGQPLLDVMVNEFGAYTKELYEQFIKYGTLTVNQKSITLDYILKNNDFVSNVIHRHETPVLAASLKIIYKSDDLIVVDKPPSIPVHPCGNYRHNSVTFILAKEYNLHNLHPIHRIDRLTSGLLMFGLNLEIAKKFMNEIKERQVQKEYLCRVEGDFPQEIIVCREPIEVLCHKIGICAVGPNGKECTTEFKKLSYNGKSSVVLCKPLTGRTHQIRVHLQYLGYPIVNDPLYNTELFGPNKGKAGEFGKSKEELIKLITETHTTEKWLVKDSNYVNEEIHSITGNDKDDNILNETEVSISKPLETCPVSSPLLHYINSEEFLELAKKYQYDTRKMMKDSLCQSCKKKYRDPKPHELLIFLHAHRYKGEGWDFQTEIPNWAKEEWNEN